MTDTTKRRLAATLAAVLALFVIACTPEGGGKAPGGDDEQRSLQLKAWVSQSCSPYTLNLSSSGRGLIPEPELHIAGGGWDHVITYQSGARIHFTIDVTAKKGCTNGWCIIDDGRFGNKQVSLNQYGKASCDYTTKG